MPLCHVIKSWEPRFRDSGRLPLAASRPKPSFPARILIKRGFGGAKRKASLPAKPEHPPRNNRLNTLKERKLYY